MAKDSGTVNIHGKEYRTVASRVQEFREKHALDYGIETEIVSIDETTVVMKSTIRDKEARIIATGHAEETRTSSQINRTSALENCETSAIGRALAGFGLGGTEFASADEVANAIHQQKPLSHKEAVDKVFKQEASELMSDAQANMIKGMYDQKQYSKEDRVGDIALMGYDPHNLTKSDASQVIKNLMESKEQINA